MKKKLNLPVCLFILALILCIGSVHYSAASVQAATVTKNDQHLPREDPREIKYALKKHSGDDPCKIGDRRSEAVTFCLATEKPGRHVSP